MGKRKSAQRADMRPWASAHLDCKEGRFVQLGNSLMLSKAFQVLSTGARMLYICACAECGGRRQFTFPSRTMKKYGIPERSGRRYLIELEERGFITCVCSGKNTRHDSDYEFCLNWKNL